MDNIYSQALSVFAWLGREAQKSHLAMHQIKQLITILPTIKKPPRWDSLEEYDLPNKDDPV